MARLLLLLERGVMSGHGNGFGSWPSAPLAIGLFVAVGVLMGLCAHQPAANENPNKTSSDKLVTRTFSRNKTNSQKKREGGLGGGDNHEHEIRVDVSAQVPLPLSPPSPSPPQRKNSKEGRKKEGGGGGGYEKKGKIGGEKVSTGGFGEGGLWQKSILRGEKCQLPEFSGVIFYDSRGNQLHLSS
ncbi:hypothetical protein LINPERPRIM_LOCUS29308 [Linum perenne]